MDIKMFIEFPGILITIGVLLLIVAIIIGIVAFKKVDENENTNLFNREIEDYENEQNEIGTDIPDDMIEEVPINQSNFDNYIPHEDLDKTHVFENNFIENEMENNEIKEVTIEETQPQIEQMPVFKTPIVETSVYKEPEVETPVNEDEEDIELL